MTTLNFNAHDFEPEFGYDPVPADEYVAAIVHSEMKTTKNGLGRYLELSFQIIEGKFKNRRVWSRLNLENPKPEAVKFAQGELSAICRAVGVMEPKDSVELHNLPLIIDVKCRRRGDTGDITNEIRDYKKKSQNGSRGDDNEQPPWARGNASA